MTDGGRETLKGRELVGDRPVLEPAAGRPVVRYQWPAARRPRWAVIGRLRRRSCIATTGWTMTPRGPIATRRRAIPQPTGRHRRADLIGPVRHRRAGHPTRGISRAPRRWRLQAPDAVAARPAAKDRLGVGVGMSRPFVYETPGHPEPLGRQPPPSAWAGAAIPVPGHRYRDRNRDGAATRRRRPGPTATTGSGPKATLRPDGQAHSLLDAGRILLERLLGSGTSGRSLPGCGRVSGSRGRGEPPPGRVWP